MKKDILVNEDNSEVTLSLSLTRRVMARDPRMTITTKMAQAMLENENFKLDKCVVSDIIDNHKASSKHEGIWKFSLVKELPAISEEPTETIKVKTTVKRASNKKKKKK